MFRVSERGLNCNHRAQADRGTSLTIANPTCECNHSELRTGVPLHSLPLVAHSVPVIAEKIMLDHFENVLHFLATCTAASAATCAVPKSLAKGLPG